MAPYKQLFGDDETTMMMMMMMMMMQANNKNTIIRTQFNTINIDLAQKSLKPFFAVQSSFLRYWFTEIPKNPIWYMHYTVLFVLTLILGSYCSCPPTSSTTMGG